MKTTVIVGLLAAVTVGLVLAGIAPVPAVGLSILVGVGAAILLLAIGILVAGKESRLRSGFLAGLREGLKPLTDVFRRR